MVQPPPEKSNSLRCDAADLLRRRHHSFLPPQSHQPQKFLIGLAILFLCCVLTPFLIHPPVIVVYETYRDATKAGKIEHAIYAPIPYSPNDHLRDNPGSQLQAPSSEHWIGTTSDAADLMANMLYATRIAFSIGFISTGIALTIGVIVGGLMGYFVGIVDLIGMRLVEIFDAIPTLLLLLCFVAVFTPQSLHR